MLSLAVTVSATARDTERDQRANKQQCNSAADNATDQCNVVIERRSGGHCDCR